MWIHMQKNLTINVITVPTMNVVIFNSNCNKFCKHWNGSGDLWCTFFFFFKGECYIWSNKVDFLSCLIYALSGRCGHVGCMASIDCICGMLHWWCRSLCNVLFLVVGVRGAYSKMIKAIQQWHLVFLSKMLTQSVFQCNVNSSLSLNLYRLLKHWYAKNQPHQKSHCT